MTAKSMSAAAGEIISMLEEQGEEDNTLQRVLKEFLTRNLSVTIDTEDTGFYDYNRTRVKVKLKLGNEVISEDYFTV